MKIRYSGNSSYFLTICFLKKLDLWFFTNTVSCASLQKKSESVKIAQKFLYIRNTMITKRSSSNFTFNIKGTVMQIEKSLINDRLRVS